MTLRGLHDEVPVDLVAILSDGQSNDHERVVPTVDQIAGLPRRSRRPEQTEILPGLADQTVRRHSAGGYR